MKVSALLSLSLWLAGIITPLVGQATVYDAASAFSPTANPNGVWSYGFSAALGSPMVLDLERATDNGIDIWRTNIWLGAPAVFHNGTSSTITNSTGTLVMPPGALALHPGPGGQYSLLRFTAPTNGAYQIAAAFSGLDIVGTTTDVHVLTNGVPIFNGQVNGYGPGPGFNGTVSLPPGGTIDFAVGWGANQEFSFDSTGLSAQITTAGFTSPGCTTPPAGLVSWWPASGSPADVVGSNSGVPVGSVAYTGGEVGQAFSFSGGNYVLVTNSPSLNPAGSFSIECWAYPLQDGSVQQMLVGKWGDNFELDNQRSYALTLQPGLAVGLAISDAAHQWDSSFHTFFSPAGSVSLQAWNHIVGVYDQSTGTRTIYVNGAKVAERTDAPITVLNSASPLSFGAWYRAASWLDAPYNGGLDEVSFYNRALTGAQVQSLYAAGGAGKCSPAIAPVITAQPASVFTNVGANVSFRVAATGTAPLSYQWFFNGQKLTGKTTAALSLTSVQLTNAGTYSVVVSNVAGTVPSSNALLVLNGPTGCFAPPVGLVSWWPAQGNAFDAVGLNNPSVVNQIIFTTGEVGTGFSFNGVNSYIDIGATPAITVGLSNGFTVEGWIKPANNTASMVIVEYERALGTYSASDVGLDFSVNSHGLGTIDGNIKGSDQSNHEFGSAPGLITPGVWQHVAVTYDRGSGIAHFYVNGSSVVTTNIGSFTPLTSFTNVLIGARTTFTSAQYPNTVFSGGIDELSIYSRALTGQEIQSLYTAGSSGKCFQPSAPTITLQPVSQVTSLGLNAGFSVAASGTQPLFYQWFFNGAKLPGKTTTALNLPNVQLTNAGTYSVIVSNSAGVAPSSNAVLSVVTPLCVEPPAGIVAWWPGNSNANDVVGGLNGSLYKGTRFAPGQVGTAFAFDGVQNCVTNPMPGLTNIVNSYTMEFWALPTGSRASTPQTTSGIYGTSGQRYAIFPAFGGLGTVGAGVSVGTNGISVFEHGYAYLSSLLVYDAPVLGWTHIAVVYTNRQPSLYVNGVLVKTGLVSTRISCPSTFFGEAGATSGNYGYYAGLLDEVSIYNRPLSGAEVRGIYLSSVIGKCTTPPLITTQPVNRQTIEGSNVTFSVTASGDPILHYQWLFNGASIPGATGTMLSLTNVQWTNGGSYSVVVANGFGTNLSSSARLDVDRIPVAQCASVVVSAGPNCTALASIDQGSYDPDGDPLTLTQTPVGPYPLGTNLVTLTVSDGRGASNACSALVVVLDQTPPTLTLPADIVVTNAHNAWTSVVTYAPSAADNCSGVGQPVCVPPSGTAFSLGTTTVSVSATDAAGNTAHGSFKVTVLPGNVPPVPVIEIQPLAHFPGNTNLLVIAPDNQQATVVLDGSKSYDLDDTNFLSFWYEGTNLLSSNLVATTVLKLGTNDITLWLDDTFPLGTNSASAEVQVISPAQAIQLVASLLQDPHKPNLQPLLASLKAATAAFGRGDFTAGVNELQAFENKVSAQLAPEDAALADELLQAAQQVVNALTPVVATGPAHVKFLTLSHQGGKMHLKFAGHSGKVHLVQASTNMLDWQTIGVANDQGNGAFDFEDTKAAGVPARFYRIVVP